MKKSNLIAVDLAKNTFQVCLFDKQGKIVSNKAMKSAAFPKYLVKQPPAIVAFEACGSAHHYARLAEKLGHQAVLYTPKIVSANRQGQKTDKNDAAAIGFTAQQPNLKTVAIKTVDQQNAQSLLRIQQHFSDQAVATSNMIRGLLMEFGIKIPKGSASLGTHVALALEDAENDIAFAVREALSDAWKHWLSIQAQVKSLEQSIKALVSSVESCNRLTELEGIGDKNALAVFADMGNGSKYKNGRNASACIGVTPTQHSTGGRVNLGHIRKGYMANSKLRSTLILGAWAVLNRLERRPPKNEKERWLKQLMERRGKGRAAVALVNKNIRTAWSMLVYDTQYRVPQALAN